MDMIDQVLKLKLPIGQYTIFGSGILDVLRIRKSSDMDIVVLPKLYEKLKENSVWKEKMKHGDRVLINNDFEIYDSWNIGQYCPTPEELINKSIVIDGVPFVNINEVLKWKKSFARPKDLQDVKLIETYLVESDK